MATQLVIEGMPINQVAEFLGHSPYMTLMLYGRHLDQEAMRNVGRAATRITTPPPKREAPTRTAEAPKKRADAVDPATADAAILALAEHAPVTNAAAQKATGMTRRQISKSLVRLVRRGLLIQRGTRKGSHYIRAG